MTLEQRIYEAERIIQWLVDGYGTNLILKNGLAKNITAEWIVANYNVEMSFFRPHLKETPTLPDILILLERKSPTTYEVHHKVIDQTKNLILTTKDKEFAERLVNGYNNANIITWNNLH